MVGLYLGPCGGPRGGAVSYERGTPVTNSYSRFRATPAEAAVEGDSDGGTSLRERSVGTWVSAISRSIFFFFFFITLKPRVE